jgi:hypothetical protein
MLVANVRGWANRLLVVELCGRFFRGPILGRHDIGVRFILLCQLLRNAARARGRFNLATSAVLTPGDWPIMLVARK